MLISNSCKLKVYSKEAIIIKHRRSFGVQIGFSGSMALQDLKGATIMVGRSGKIVFEGQAALGCGTSIRVDNGCLLIGDNFSCNKNCFISCSEGISFGDDVLLGWNVSIRDADGHTIFSDGKRNNLPTKINIGNHVWIASFVDILKGVEISDGCVVGYRSCVIKPILTPNCLVVGYPAQIVKEKVRWEK